jgi:hypothetical protein
VRYGVLDDFGEVLRWQWSKPSKAYRYVTQRVAPTPAVNWQDFEPALF